MPYILMSIFVIIFIASYVFPIKWILDTDSANAQEKTVFVLLTIPLWLFSYYLFCVYMRQRYSS